MKITKTFIKQVVNKVNNSITTIDSDRLQCAKDILWAKNVINWKYSEYGSWNKFITTLTISIVTVYRYEVVAKLIEKYRYTDSQCLTIIKAIGWHNFTRGILEINRRMAIKTFIKTYASQKYAAGNYNKNGDRSYMFGLPKKEANLLDLHLMNYGMRISNKRRTGVRAAMIQLINNKLK